MKKMNVYEAPVAEVIEMTLNATVLSASSTDPITGEGYEFGGIFSKKWFEINWIINQKTWN